MVYNITSKGVSSPMIIGVQLTYILKSLLYSPGWKFSITSLKEISLVVKHTHPVCVIWLYISKYT